MIGDDQSGSPARAVRRRLSDLDRAAYRAVAATTTPALDAPLRRLSESANGALLWLGLAGLLAAFGGRRGRQAAGAGLLAIGVSTALVNLVLKQLARRTRPDRSGAAGAARHTTMPASTSFPSGHSASAWAFATAVGHLVPSLSVPLKLLAAAVAYSRVHAGVHYPGDVLVGSAVGGAVGRAVGAQVARRVTRPS